MKEIHDIKIEAPLRLNQDYVDGMKAAYDDVTKICHNMANKLPDFNSTHRLLKNIAQGVTERSEIIEQTAKDILK